MALTPTLLRTVLVAERADLTGCGEPRRQGWDGVTIAGIYPFQTPDDLGPAYCPVCQTCTPPPAGFLVCQ